MQILYDSSKDVSLIFTQQFLDAYAYITIRTARFHRKFYLKPSTTDDYP